MNQRKGVFVSSLIEEGEIKFGIEESKQIWEILTCTVDCTVKILFW